MVELNYMNRNVLTSLYYNCISELNSSVHYNLNGKQDYWFNIAHKSPA